MKRIIVIAILLTATFSGIAMFGTRHTYAASFTSTTSGSWGSPATWGGVGVPGCGDDVTIAGGTTVQLDNTRCSNNLTINSGGTLDLNGQVFNFQNTGTTFTNNGTLANTAGFNEFYFYGTGAAGSIMQSFAGAGTYSGNLRIRVYNGVTVNVAPSTSITFNSATNNNNFQIDGSSTLDLTNALSFIAPSSGANYVGFTNNQSIIGAGGLKTQGNVTIIGNAGQGSFTAPVEIVSGAANGYGTFSGAFTVDGNASFLMNSTLNLYGDLTIPSGATLDLNGQVVQFFGNNKTLTNNGTFANTAGFNEFYFYGTGAAGSIMQSFAGAGTYSGNLRIRVYNGVTVNVAPSTSITFNSATNNNNFQIDGSSTLDLTNALTFIAPSTGTAYVGFTNNQSIIGAGGLKTQGNVSLIGNAGAGSFTAPVEIVSGAANGYGTFSGAFTVDGNASFLMNSTLNIFGNLTIQSAAAIDMNGQALQFYGDGKTFTNNGTLTNSNAGFNAFYFYGNGSDGISPNPPRIMQSVAGAGNYGSNLQLRLYNTVILATASTTAFNGLLNFSVDGGSTLNLTNALTFTGPAAPSPTFAVITNNGLIQGSALKTQGNVQIISSGTFSASLEVVNGTTLTQGNFNGAVTIDGTATLKLTSTLNPFGDLTIQSGGTLDLNGQALQFQGNNKTFTNNGTLTNTAGFNAFYLYGNGTPGGITQSLTGAGTYSASLTLRLYNIVTVNAAAATTLTFDSPTNNTNFQVDGSSTLNLAGALTVAAPLTGANYVGIINNGTVSGSTFKTQGNVQTVSNSAGFTSAFEVVSGAALGHGRFDGTFTVDGSASFKMSSTLDLFGNLTISNGATLDFNGQALQFQGNNKTFANNGSVINTAGFNVLYFYGNGTPGGSGNGGVTQHFATSAGSFTDNLLERIYNNNTLILDGDAQLGFVQIDGGSTLDITNRTLKLSGAGNALTVLGSIITTGSTIELDGTAAQTVQTNLNGASINSLTINNAAGVTLSNPLTIPAVATLTLLNGTFNINNATPPPANFLTLADGATIARAGTGTLSEAPTFAGAINIIYIGTTAITPSFEIPATNTVNNLTLNLSNTVTLSNPLTVNGALTFTNGFVQTGTNALNVSASGTAGTHTTGYVLGNLKKTYGGATSFRYDVGTATGYAPVTAQATSGTGDLNIVAKQPKQPNIAGAEALQRYWTLAGSGITANLTFQYNDADVVGNEAAYQVFRYNAGFTAPQPQSVDTANNRGTANGVSSFAGDWTLAEPGAVFGRFQFAAANDTVNENAGTKTVTVNRASGTSGIVTVNFANSNGTATGGASCSTAGVDYVTTSGTLTFGDTETSKTFPITICNDNVFENANETVNLTLSNATGGAVFGTPSTSVLTIVDDDLQPTISISDVFVSEPSTGTSPANFTVTLSNPSVQTITVHYSTTDGTATSPGDYQAASGTVTFNPLEISKTITVQVNADAQQEPNETFFVNLDTPTNATIADAQGQGTITDFVAASSVLINEFRFRGTAGIGDEFIELLNNTDSDITVATSDGSAGWSIIAADSIVRVVIANGTLIRAHGHYLAGCGCTYFSPDINFIGGDIPTNSGIALYKSAQNLTPANKLDAVGFSGTVAGFFEGTPLTPIPDVNAEYSFVRKIPGISAGNGKSVDTDNNANDFVLVSTTGNVGGVSTALGAPSPDGVNAPRLNNAVMPALIDPMVAGSGAPNRARLFCRQPADPDNGAPLCSDVDPNTSTNGFLSIRRKFTNNTGANVTRLRFSIIDITTLNNTDGLAAPVADLRAITSTDVMVTTSTGAALVRGTTLTQPPAQPNGGGVNSILSAGSVTTTPLAQGDSINVQFLLGVKAIGNFRFYVNIEALP